MVNYQNGKIYKIECNAKGKVYVGSTAEPTLARKLAKHVNNYKEYLKGKSHFITSFEILKNEDYDIVLLEDCPCDRKDQLHAREKHYIKTIECVNKIVTGRSLSEYYDDNRDKILEHVKDYQEQNKDKIKK